MSRSETTAINENRMMVYSVTLEMSVKNLDEARKNISQEIKNYSGYIVRESDNYISTRIPSEKMDDFVNTIKKLGKTESVTKTGTDITDQYLDDTIRLESLKNVRGRYLALLEKANAVIEILSIEKELERINTEIEVLEGRIKASEMRVAYSNITIRYKEPVRPGILGWVFVGLYRGIAWLFVWS